MRDKLNNNPVAQMGAIAVLLILAGFLVLSSMGGGEAPESTSTTEAEVSAAPEGTAAVAPTGIPVEAGAPASISGAPDVPAPPLPAPVTKAFEANRTVVLLVVKKGGADDGVAAATALAGLATMQDVSVFVVPVDRIARYAEITQAVEVERVPALVVVTPKHLDRGAPAASVSYGFQSAQSVVQAVVDARYRGHTIDYHP
jgi:hypothetical protein